MRRYLTICAAALVAATALAQEDIQYRASALINASSGDFAPYFISALQHGKISQRHDALLDVGLERSIDTTQRFSWSYGVEAIAGYGSKNDYLRYNATDGQWFSHSEGPKAVWLQQLYGSLKYRGVILTVGMQEQTSVLLNPTLSSGDMTLSGNTRPIPQGRIGFINFQNIPFTNGWVQIYGTVAYGKFTDSGWSKSHYNYYTNHISLGEYYTYKNIYFRTKPTAPFVATIGAQWAGAFGGETTWYNAGREVRHEKRKAGFKEFWKMMLPTQTGDDGYYDGNHLGTLDLKLQYRLPAGQTLAAYTQWPWEDGSGLRKGNGWDGLWGVEYASGAKTWLSGAVFEYLDFTNQSGPLHYAPGDHPESDIDHNATGADDYYNNFYYSPWANYGQSIGTPFLVAPAYNLDGYPQYLHNRARGCHVAVQGWLTPQLQYTVKYSYQQAWGNGRVPTLHSLHDNSWSVQCAYDAQRLLRGLSLSLQLAGDHGNLRGNTFGALLTATYSGNFTLGKR